MASFKSLLSALAVFILILAIATEVSAGPPPRYGFAYREEELLRQSSRSSKTKTQQPFERARLDNHDSTRGISEYQGRPGKKTAPKPSITLSPAQKAELMSNYQHELGYFNINSPETSKSEAQYRPVQCTCEAQVKQLNETLQSQIQELQTKINKLTQPSQSPQQMFQLIKPLDIPHKKAPKQVPG